GEVEIVRGSSRESAWERFLEALDRGVPGLWIGRLFPRALQAAAASMDARFLWLSGADRPNSVRPSDLAALLAEVDRSIRDESVRVVILEEIEYLTALNGTEVVRKFLRELDALARRTDVRIWIPLVPELLGSDPAPLESFRDAAGA
ncbi:MAG: DUF835 domain-containing protein, partial [Thermoplasmata archaeon]